jgi:hypothetical protein
MPQHKEPQSYRRVYNDLLDCSPVLATIMIVLCTCHHTSSRRCRDDCNNTMQVYTCRKWSAAALVLRVRIRQHGVDIVD